MLWITEAANRGYQPAQIDLALKYQNGTGVDRNAKKATYWFSRVAGDDRDPPILISSAAGNLESVPCADKYTQKLRQTDSGQGTSSAQETVPTV